VFLVTDFALDTDVTVFPTQFQSTMDSNKAEILGSQKKQHHGQEHQQNHVKGTIIYFFFRLFSGSPNLYTSYFWSGSYAWTIQNE
jgi:hypothetical protein